MPKITALIHAYDEVSTLGRALDSLRGCDEVLVVNHGNQEVEKLAREHGASARTGVPGVALGAYLIDAKNDWILCLLPNEALSDALQAAVAQWKEQEHGPEQSFSAVLREQAENGWVEHEPVTRLVNRTCVNWTDALPPDSAASQPLAGELLRFRT